jgi:2-aminoadipate transaminase
MAVAPLALSQKSRRTEEPPITWLIQAALENPNLISLAAGLVDQDSLPIESIAAVVQELKSGKNGKAALQYGTTRGLTPLREWIVQHVAALDRSSPNELHWSSENVVVTTGSQQFLYLLSEILLDPGDIVLTEAPSYFVNHGVLTSHGALVHTIPMDDDGMRMDALSAHLDELARRELIGRVKLLYTCDYYQNPSGRTLSAERRSELLRLIQRHSDISRIVVLEDAAYRELGFSGVDLPSIKSHDHGNQHVIYAGTFSKPCAPGMKTGYAILPADLTRPILELKGVHDFGSSNFDQHVIEGFVAGGGYAAHVRSLREIYRSKCAAMLTALDAEFSDLREVQWTRPAGGMFLWMTFPENVSTGPGGGLLEAAMREGMLYVPGEFCHVPDANGKMRYNEIRLSFGVERPDRIVEAVRRLRRAVRTACGC